MDIIMNFLALVIIADFDDYFVQTLYQNPILKKLENGEDISRLGLLIQTTTSRNAQLITVGNILENPKEEEEVAGTPAPAPEILEEATPAPAKASV